MRWLKQRPILVFWSICAQMITNWIVFTMSSVDIFKMIIETTNWLCARIFRFVPLSLSLSLYLFLFRAPFSRFDTLQLQMVLFFHCVFINEMNRTTPHHGFAFDASNAFKSIREIHFILIGLIYTHLRHLFMEYLYVHTSNRIWMLLSLCWFFFAFSLNSPKILIHTLPVSLVLFFHVQCPTSTFHLERGKSYVQSSKEMRSRFKYNNNREFQTSAIGKYILLMPFSL